MVVQGSYYTSEKIVNKVFELLKKNICNYSDYVLIDTSCGYGSFLRDKEFKSVIGNDIDKGVAEKCPSDTTITFLNALCLISWRSEGWQGGDPEVKLFLLAFQ